jgi:putative phosphoesterase
MIGILSDTHDNMEAIEAAVEYFNREGVEMVLHAGDLVSPFTAPSFGELRCPMVAVLGNNEGALWLLGKKFRDIGVELQDFAVQEAGGRRIAVYHGTIPQLKEALLASSKYDVVVTGHTHEPEVSRVGDTLGINPGEACGYLTGKRTLALLDPETLECEILEF